MGSRIYRHIVGTQVKADFSGCGRFRYTLTVDYEPATGGRTVCVVMENPSYANEAYADKSVQFLEKLIFLKQYLQFAGVRRLIVVNQFAFIQTEKFKGETGQIGPRNDQAIKEALEEADIVLIAWGKANPHHTRSLQILSMIRESQPESVYVTKKHPSRGTYEDFIEGFSF